jgi:hypothetical protein
MKRLPLDDERLVGTATKIAAVMLPLTQLTLLVAVLYRAYVLKQADHEYADLRIVLGVSVFGTIGALLFWVGSFPLLKARTLFMVYAALAIGLFAVLSAIYGLPTLENWTTTLLPVLVGPAILVGLYAAVAYVGQRRIEKEIASFDATEGE